MYFHRQTKFIVYFTLRFTYHSSTISECCKGCQLFLRKFRDLLPKTETYRYMLFHNILHREPLNITNLIFSENCFYVQINMLNNNTVFFYNFCDGTHIYR